MTHTIVSNGHDFEAFDWREAAPAPVGEKPRHLRDENLFEKGVDGLGPGEVSFTCDQTLAFDTLFELKGDGRKFVVIAAESGRHVAKPY